MDNGKMNILPNFMLNNETVPWIKVVSVVRREIYFIYQTLNKLDIKLGLPIRHVNHSFLIDNYMCLTACFWLL